MTFKSLQSGSLVGLDLSEDGVVLLEESRRLELDNKSSSFLEGTNHSVVIVDGFIESSNGGVVNIVSFNQFLGGSVSLTFLVSLVSNSGF